MRRKMMALMVAMVMVLSLLVGCGDKAAGDTTELNIMVWDGTWDEEVFKDFEKETGIHVNVSYIDNTDTILSKLVQGNAEYDLIDIESAYVKSFVDNGLLTELDKSKLDNMKYIDSSCGSFVGDEDGKYTVPCIAPLYTTIVYNVETCPIEIKSFKDLADPALEGEVCMVNSTISLFGMALESLGYEASSSNEDEIKEAMDLLLDIKKNVKAFVGESAVAELENGECSVAFCWDYATLCNNSTDNWDKFAIADIDSGSEYSGTYWGIPSSSKNVDAAHELINFMLRPEEYSKSTLTWGIMPVLTQDALKDYMPEDFYDNPAIEAFAKLEPDSWKIAIDDDQISLLDTYYTKLMSGN
ncbi:MAG: PotD/PotF family extracellular solute-binding protein [Wujia sp.]